MGSIALTNPNDTQTSTANATSRASPQPEEQFMNEPGLQRDAGSEDAFLMG